ncbi:hypothetical protein HOK021_27870 [Streptomyces hygroscopicus]|nr:hypothetical protein HOK021_27870 [Streptomyces hygroscopicus]
MGGCGLLQQGAVVGVVTQAEVEVAADHRAPGELRGVVDPGHLSLAALERGQLLGGGLRVPLVQVAGEETGQLVGGDLRARGAVRTGIHQRAVVGTGEEPADNGLHVLALEGAGGVLGAPVRQLLHRAIGGGGAFHEEALGIRRAGSMALSSASARR